MTKAPEYLATWVGTGNSWGDSPSAMYVGYPSYTGDYPYYSPIGDYIPPSYPQYITYPVYYYPNPDTELKDEIKALREEIKKLRKKM